MMAANEAGSKLAEKQIADLLRQRHKIIPGESDDFTVRNMADVAATSAQ